MLELSSDDKKENQFFDSGKLKREKTRRTTLYRYHMCSSITNKLAERIM